LIALPDEKIVKFMEKIKLTKPRTESNMGLLNLSKDGGATYLEGGS
jgi:hypothetical protein